jgi:hypothetical protein
VSETNLPPQSETDLEVQRISQKSSLGKYGSPQVNSQVKISKNLNNTNHHRKNTSLGGQSIDMMKDVGGTGIPGLPSGGSRKSLAFHTALSSTAIYNYLSPRTNCKKNILEDICKENQRLFENKSNLVSGSNLGLDSTVEKTPNFVRSESTTEQKKFNSLFVRKDDLGPKSVRPFSTKFLNLKSDKTNKKRLEKKRVGGFVVS